MHEVIIKAKSVTQLRALRRWGIDISEHSVIRDERDSLLRVDAIVSDQEVNKLESEGYIVEKVSDLSKTAKARLSEVSRTNRFVDMNTPTHEEK